MKVKGRVQAIRSIRQQFSDVADPHKREKLINAAMKKGKIKLSALGEIFEFEGFNPNGQFIPLPSKGDLYAEKRRRKEMRESAARAEAEAASRKSRKRKIIRRGGAAVILGGLGTGLAINARRKKQNA